MPVPFAPHEMYRPSGRIADLILAQGQQQAEAERRRGDISGQMWSNVGNTIAGTIGDLVRQREEAPLRAQRQELGALQLQGARNEVEAQAVSKRQDDAFMSLMSGDQMPDERAIIGIYGPQRGVQIAQGLAAFQELATKRVTNARDTAGRLAIGVKSLTPEVQAQFWPAIRTAAIEGGLGDARSIPEQPLPQFLDAVIGWSSGKEPAKAEPFTLSEGQTRFGPDGKPIADVPKPPPEPKKYPVTVAGPNGLPVQKLVTEEELSAGVQAYRAPTAPASAPSKFWVMRNGQPVRVTEAEYRVGDTPASTREQGRPVTSGDAGRIAELDTSLDDVAVLTTAVSGNKSTGTAALIGSKVPNWVTEITGWGTDAKSKNAVIARVKQVIGKALEGGVLRKEDEVKYKDILPTIGDVAAVVATKLAGLETAITKRRERELDAREDAGYDVSKFRARDTKAPKGTQTIGRFEIEVEP